MYLCSFPSSYFSAFHNYENWKCRQPNPTYLSMQQLQHGIRCIIWGLFGLPRPLCKGAFVPFPWERPMPTWWSTWTCHSKSQMDPNLERVLVHPPSCLLLTCSYHPYLLPTSCMILPLLVDLHEAADVLVAWEMVTAPKLSSKLNVLWTIEHCIGKCSWKICCINM